MKRKTETVSQIEPKIPLLSPFLNEEVLDVHDIDKDVDDFLEFYNKFVKYVTEIYDNKEKTNAPTAAHFILKFKELNRKAQFRLNVSREKTKETKDAINKSHLTMQNLLYEALHLEKETNSCLDYKSLHEEIDLISVEEYTANNLLISESETSEHELTLGRLHWELWQRKNLSAQIAEAEILELQLMEEINKKKAAYSKISNNLERVVDSTGTLEEMLDMPMHGQELNNMMAERLSERLYLLYCQMRVFVVQCDRSLKVSLVCEEANVSVVLELTESGIQLILIFRWDVEVCMVTVEPRIVHLTTLDLSTLTSPFIEPGTLLSALPGDTCRNGPAYDWCQQLSHSNLKIGRIIADIRHRIRSRVSLVTAMSSLVASDHKSLTTEWNFSSFARFKAAPVGDTATFVRHGLANDRCFYFSGTIRPTTTTSVAIETGPTEVSLWLLVPHNCPTDRPVVVFGKDQGLLGRSLHLIEVEVNCGGRQLQSSEDILSGQMDTLMTALRSLFHQRGCSSSLAALFIGTKYPSDKRPFLGPST